MEELLPAIAQLGFPIVVASYLLYDYSKRLAAIEAILTELLHKQNESLKELENINARNNEIDRNRNK
jgi:hypothetical protein